MDEKVITLAEILKNHNYRTAAFIGAYVLDSLYGLDQGFQYYDDDFSEGENNDDQLFQERRAQKIINSTNKWLKQNHTSPFFIWVHLFDPHAPYNAPSPFGMIYQNNPYDGEIAYTDHCLGELFKTLKKLDVYENTLIILTSDHGESLGEHKEDTHGVFIYDATLRVPLIIRGNSFAPQIIPTLVSTIDISPTILDILQIKGQDSFQGKSLLDLIHHKSKEEERILYCESYLPYYNHGWSPLTGIRTNTWKYIKAPKPELYNLIKDPQETQNQITINQEIKTQMEKQLEKFLSSSPEKKEKKMILPGPDQLERLRKLGYLVTASPSEQENILADPKDKIWLLEYLNRGIGYLESKDPNRAIFQFQNLIEKDPQNLFGHLILGSTYCQKKFYDKALEEFQKVALIDDGYMDIHGRLAFVFKAKGLIERAIEEYKLAIKKFPKCAENYDLLANIYLETGKYDEAITHFKKALKLKSKFILAHNNLGLAYGKIKQYSLALDELQEAVKEKPEIAEIYNNLGCIYLETGILFEHRNNVPQFPITPEEVKNIFQRIPELQKNPSFAFDLAKNAFLEALKIDPEYKEARVNLGITYLNLKSYEKAIAEYNQIITSDPTDIDAQLNLSFIYLQAGFSKKGVKELEKILQKDPNNIKAYYYLGSTFLKIGQINKAVFNYSRITELQPQNPDAHFFLGIAYQANKQNEKAIDEYRKALRINPHHQKAKKKLDELLNPT